MLTFFYYSVILGFAVLFPVSLVVTYYDNPRGKREITYLGAMATMIVCVIPVLNIFIGIATVVSACEVVTRNLSGRAMISDREKK